MPKIRYKKKDATRPLAFTVTPQHVEDAVCADPRCCVLALAIKERFGDLFEDIQVGLTSTKLYRGDGTVVRYRTPAALRVVLREFDRTGRWLMTAGEYRLPAPKPSAAAGTRNRLDKMTPRKKSKKRKPSSKPTRTVARIDAVVPV